MVGKNGHKFNAWQCVLIANSFPNKSVYTEKNTFLPSFSSQLSLFTYMRVCVRGSEREDIERVSR
jgi:hypothetical protein